MAAIHADLVYQSEAAQPAAVEAALEVLRAGKDEAHAVLLGRAVKALSRSVAALDRDDALTAAAAGSDLEALVDALDDALIQSANTANIPYTRSRLRGLLARRRLLESEGGVVPTATVAALLGITRQAVQKRRTRGHLLALPIGRREYAFPAWQFGPDGTVLPGLEGALEALAGHDPWMQLVFFLGQDARLDAATPLDALRRGEIAAVVSAATAFGEHGAD